MKPESKNTSISNEAMHFDMFADEAPVEVINFPLRFSISATITHEHNF